MMYSISCTLQLHGTAVLLIAVEKCGAEALASRAFTKAVTALHHTGACVVAADGHVNVQACSTLPMTPLPTLPTPL